MDSTDLRASAHIVWREYQLACRGPAFWATAAAAAALAIWLSSAEGATAALAAYHTWRVTVMGLCVLAILMAAAAAARDRRDASSELVLAKPMGSSAYLVVARFAGVWLSMLSAVALMLAAAGVKQLLGGTPLHLGAYTNAFVRALAPLALATAWGFSLTTLLASPLAAAVAALYWVVVPLAQQSIPYAADMTPTQHWPAPALLAAGFVALGAALYAKPVRGAGQTRARIGWAAAALLAGGLAFSVGFAFGGEDALMQRDPILSSIASQRVLDEERAPGFWSPAGDQHLVGLSDFDGRPVVLAFWAPSDPASARVLSVLKQVARDNRSADLACVAVCIDGDSGTAGPFAKEAGPEVTVVWDRGAHYGDGERLSNSPLGLAYEIKEVPTIFLLDRQRTVVRRIESHAIPILGGAVKELVATE